MVSRLRCLLVARCACLSSPRRSCGRSLLRQAAALHIVPSGVPGVLVRLLRGVIVGALHVFFGEQLPPQSDAACHLDGVLLRVVNPLRQSAAALLLLFDSFVQLPSSRGADCYPGQIFSHARSFCAMCAPQSWR